MYKKEKKERKGSPLLIPRVRKSIGLATTSTQHTLVSSREPVRIVALLGEEKPTGITQSSFLSFAIHLCIHPSAVSSSLLSFSLFIIRLFFFFTLSLSRVFLLYIAFVIAMSHNVRERPRERERERDRERIEKRERERTDQYFWVARLARLSCWFPISPGWLNVSPTQRENGQKWPCPPTRHVDRPSCVHRQARQFLSFSSLHLVSVKRWNNVGQQVTSRHSDNTLRERREEKKEEETVSFDVFLMTRSSLEIFSTLPLHCLRLVLDELFGQTSTRWRQTSFDEGKNQRMKNG